MSQEIVVAGESTRLSEQDARDLKSLLESHALARSTLRAYRQTIAEFEEWRAVQGYAADAAGVAAFLLALDRAGAKTPTIKKKLAALRYVHDGAKAREVDAVLDAIVRRRAEALTDPGIDVPVRGNASASKGQVTPDMLHAMCRREPRGLKELRDRALLLTGFWLAARRSELVALNVEDVQWVQKGALVRIARSKTDQVAEGHTKPLAALMDNKAICPITALKAWLAASRIDSGAMFVGLTPQDKLPKKPKRLTPQVVALVVKAACAEAGIDPGAFAGHSLRSGFVTAARQAGLSDHHIKSVTGHRTDIMLDRYDKRDARDALRAIQDKMGGVE